MAKRVQRAGRKPSTGRIRELISVLGSLSKSGDRVSLDSLASRLGITRDEAAGLMDIVCQASGEETGGLLISSNDDMTEFTLEYPAIHGRPIRLTTAETIAVVHALDLAEVSSDDPLRERLHTAFSSPEVNDVEVRKALGMSLPTRDGDNTIRMLCARSQSESRMLNFLYRGLADNSPHERCVLVRNLRLDDSHWYAYAYDLDRLEDRIFRLDRMSSVTLGHHGALPDLTESAASNNRMVKVTFEDPTYITLLDWPDISITRRTAYTVNAVLPYYGEHSDWLLRRIIACKGTLKVHDKRIMQLAKEYARTLT